MANVNGFDPGPYAVDGSRIRAATLRAGLFSSTGGAEGVVQAADLKVRPLPTPGAGIAIDRGTALILNRSGNVTGETYAARAPLGSTVDGPAAAGAARSHLVVVRIEDPEFSPWTLPQGTDPATYQYPKPIIVQNVAPGTTSAAQLNLGYSALALARLDIPANTSTITEGMIKDLRKVARPRRERRVSMWRPADGVKEIKGPPQGAGFQVFPSMSELVPTPSWATQVKMIVNVGGLLQANGNITGGMKAEYGGNGDAYLSTDVSGIHWVSGGQVERTTIVIAGELALSAAYRGEDHYVRLSTQINNPTAPLTGALQADEWTTVTVDLEFVEVPE